MGTQVSMGASQKPYVVAVIIQLIYTGMFIVSKAAFDQGMNSYVFVFYRQAADSALLLPLALLFNRKNAQSMSYMLLLKLFLCALIGITLSLNLYHVCLKFTSATVASATDNSAPAVTFFLALLLRMEYVKLKSLSGIAKLSGVVLCIAGVLVIAFYIGPSLSPVNHHRAFHSHALGSGANVSTRGAWAKWTLLMVLANMGWSLWIVMQAVVLKEYPNKMLVTAVQCVFSAVQSFLVAVVAERDFSRWKLRLDISLLAIFYSGFVVMGAAYYLQAWCVEMKGPVFLAVWTPLCFVFTMFCSSFFLGGDCSTRQVALWVEFCVLWGKSKESKIDDGTNGDEQEEQKRFAESDREENEHRTDAKELAASALPVEPV